MLLETILFVFIGLLGYVILCTIVAFIFMVAFGILSILVEESYNLVYDAISLVIKFLNWPIVKVKTK